MQYFILGPFVQNLGGTLGSILYFLVQVISFAGIFLILFGLFEGLVLGKWHYGYFLLGAIVIGLVGFTPAVELLTEGFPNLTSLLGF